MKREQSVAVFLIFTIFLFGCNETPTSETAKIDILGSQTSSAAGMTEMENQFFLMSTLNINGTSDLDKVDFEKSNTYFKKALSDNPANLDANVGAAITEIFMVYNDTEINDALKRWEEYGSSATPFVSSLRNFGIPTTTSAMSVPLSSMGRDFMKIVQQAKADPPSIAGMQTLLRTKFLPRVNYALERLAVIEKDSAFQLKITGKMQGNMNASPVFMDLTEIYLMDAMLQGLKASISQFLVFQFTLPSYSVKDVVQAINPNNTSFFVLAPDGAVQSANVKNGMLSMISKIRSGIMFLKSETDAQGDDVIKLNNNGNGGIQSRDLDTVLTYLKKAEDALKTGFSVNIKDADSDGNDYTIQVNLFKFFDNPPSNPKKDWLPPYTVDTTANGKDILLRWTQQDYASFAFPDPTLGGTFPNMTNEMLKRLLSIDEEFAFRVYFDASNYDPASLATMTARLQVGAKSYSNKPYSYGYYYAGYDYRFFVLDQTSGTGKIFVTLNGVEKELTLNSLLNVKPKSSTYVYANVTPAPKNLVAVIDSVYEYYPLNKYRKIVKVGYLNSQYYYNNHFNIDRDSTSAGFILYATTYLNYSYQNGNYFFYFNDNNISAKKTYKYRFIPVVENYYWGIVGYLPENYSNTATITTP